jgi:hypothetical protein
MHECTNCCGDSGGWVLARDANSVHPLPELLESPLVGTRQPLEIAGIEVAFVFTSARRDPVE